MKGVRCRGWLALSVTLFAVVVFGALCFYHYRLPGLYYDEAFDVVPSMQILRGQPVQLARGVGIHLFGHAFPVMTGDYWGSVSTYAVLALFWLLGVGVLPVRLWPILAGMLAVLLTYFVGKRLYGRWVGAGASLLLAVFPSFIFWSRVGIYVISHIVAITLGIVLLFLRWRDSRQRRWLFLATLLTGIGLWTKLLFVWFLIAVPAAYVLLLLADWVTEDRISANSLRSFVGRTWQRVRTDVPLGDVADFVAAACGFLIGAFPVIYYNLVSRGSYLVLRANLFHTENGVNNFALWSNVKVEADALRVLLNGGYFWFYGGIYTNPLYPWVVGLSAIGLLILVHRVSWLQVHRRPTVFFLAFVLVVFALSCFTVSILGATHLVILLPIPQLFVAATAIFGARWLSRRIGPGRRTAASLAGIGLIALVFVPLMAEDLRVDARYHQALARTGGYSGFSSAIYSLADYLEQNKIDRPYALDWGFKYNIMIITQGQVEPLEIYGSTYEPGPDFNDALRAALATSAPIFISHTAEGSSVPRLDDFKRIVAESGRTLTLDKTFKQLDGKPVYYVFSVK
ncbi:MAG TPA: glycosyltransferase family 39 protein [Nitrolancea sp.]|nr:glycosyltransferase family 39 protein [Nitrolancea sp.]